MSVVRIQKLTFRFINEEEYKAIYPLVEAAHNHAGKPREWPRYDFWLKVYSAPRIRRQGWKSLPASRKLPHL